MIEIIYSVAASLDGYIATADGSVDWLSPFQATGEDHGAGESEGSVDALLLGSHTYEFALKLGHWPSPEKPSWVFTQRTLRVLHPCITLTHSTLPDSLRLVAAKPFKSGIVQLTYDCTQNALA